MVPNRGLSHAALCVLASISCQGAEAHCVAVRNSQAYEALGNKKQSEYHRQFFDGVMDSILSFGDGSSATVCHSGDYPDGGMGGLVAAWIPTPWNARYTSSRWG